ncbi:hypothetical protein Nepgr_027073 [Nepenthes gracilis]|uniref:RING-type E3 ubiquitin transferase n=1 Tax=Nepenthes gracilis TaxID=150966 RepID=A0AAD3Y2M0_NEPGR|nr:hypothetical protein Nepgr_027073 [Nepenthes gracilis]
MSEIKESSLAYPAQPAFSITPMNRPIAQDDLVIRFDEDSETESDESQVDIDNMSYEEILALEESIGNVNTGLSEQTILARLNHPSNHLCSAAGSPHNITGCCICQEECAEGQKLSKITCGHGFHYDCIKQWLLRKNICPLCKTAAFDV